jgi:hypothetical protein
MHTMRNQGNVAITTSSTQLVGPNPRRKALIISAPQPLTDSEKNASVLVKGADTSTTGVKASYTVPAASTATLVFASLNETTGTTVVAALELKRGANVYQLTSFTAVGTFEGTVPLSAGDIVQWDVTTAVALSVTDFVLAVELDQLDQYITVVLGSPAVLDGGVDIYPGASPLYLDFDTLGDSIREEVSAIASQSTTTIGFIDIFG